MIEPQSIDGRCLQQGSSTHEDGRTDSGDRELKTGSSTSVSRVSSGGRLGGSSRRHRIGRVGAGAGAGAGARSASRSAGRAGTASLRAGGGSRCDEARAGGSGATGGSSSGSRFGRRDI